MTVRRAGLREFISAPMLQEHVTVRVSSDCGAPGVGITLPGLGPTHVTQSGNDRTDAGKPDSGKAGETAVSIPSPTRAGGNGLYVQNCILGRISTKESGFPRGCI